MNIKYTSKTIILFSTLLFLSSNAFTKPLSEICKTEPISECLINEAEKLINMINDDERKKINQAIIATTWSTVGSNDKAIKIEEKTDGPTKEHVRFRYYLYKFNF